MNQNTKLKQQIKISGIECPVRACCCEGSATAEDSPAATLSHAASRRDVVNR